MALGRHSVYKFDIKCILNEMTRRGRMFEQIVWLVCYGKWNDSYFNIPERNLHLSILHDKGGCGKKELVLRTCLHDAGTRFLEIYFRTFFANIRFLIERDFSSLIPIAEQILFKYKNASAEYFFLLDLLKWSYFIQNALEDLQHGSQISRQFDSIRGIFCRGVMPQLKLIWQYNGLTQSQK